MASEVSDPALLEREPELAAIEDTLENAVQGEGRLVLVRGEAGIGKTSLLMAAVEAARSRGFRVLTVRADSLETELSFGVCAQLFAEVAAAPAGEGPDPFTGAAEHARPILGGAAGIPQAIGEDRLMSLVHGLYWLTSNLADAEPLMLCVDDAHWADLPSLRFAHYLARRLEGLRAVLLMAARPPERGIGHFEVFTGLATQVDAVVLEPVSLSEDAVSRLVNAEVGDADPEFLSACHELSGGNPLYLLELLRSARERGLEPSGEGAETLSGLRPEGIAESVLSRLAGLGADASRLAEIAAVGAGRLQLRDAAELAGVEREAARRAADALIAGSILSGGEPLRFAHPLVQSALYASVPEAERAGLHLRIAELLRNREAGRGAAVHLLNAERGGGDWVVDALEAAAIEEMTQGSPGQAARFLRRALEEDPPEERRGRLLVTLGLAETEAGDPQGAERLIAASELLPQPEERAGALLALGTATTLQARVAEATSAYERGLAEIAGIGGPVAQSLEAMFAIGLDQTLDSRARALPRMEALIEAPGIDETATGRALLAHAASERAYQGGSLEELRDLAARATAPGLDTDDPMAFWAYFFAAYAYEDSDDFELAEQAIANALALARSRGSIVQAAAAHHPRSFVNLRKGNVEAAVADAQTTVEGAERGWRVGLPSGAAVLGEALLERGEIDRAAEACRLPGGDERWSQLISYTWLQDTRARIDLERGDAESALATFLACGELRDRAKLTNPSVLAWRSGAAIAANRLGREDQARELAETELRLAEDFGTPRAIGVAELTLGLIDPSDEGIERIRRALAVLEPSQARTEHSRALVELGAALRRAGHRREAREPLKEGLEMAHRCGAALIAQRAGVELASAGARPRRVELTGVESLTPSERRIAAMAAEGMSNPQIAQALFLTRRTVEMHLTNAYRKLEIDSREELPAAMG